MLDLFQNLPFLHNLEKWYLHSSGEKPLNSFTNISCLVNLNTLGLSNMCLKPWIVSTLASLSSLTCLKLKSGCFFERDQDVGILTNPSLKKLVLPLLTTGYNAHLPKLTNLTHLFVPITSERGEFPEIGSNLKTLHLDINDGPLPLNLDRQTGLTWLKLKNLSPDWRSQISACPALEKLTMDLLAADSPDTLHVVAQKFPNLNCLEFLDPVPTLYRNDLLSFRGQECLENLENGIPDLIAENSKLECIKPHCLATAFWNAQIDFGRPHLDLNELFDL